MGRPFVDMSKLCPNQGNRQLLVMRLIDRDMTADDVQESFDRNAAAWEAGGIHYAELIYDDAPRDRWVFGSP
jgi:hypothetical protein